MVISGHWLTKRKALFVCLCLVGVVSAKEQAASPDLNHTVIPSEHITAIRNLYCDPAISTQQIAHYNGVANPDLIYPGDVIRLKSSWLKATKLPINVIVFSGDVKVIKHNKTAREPLIILLLMCSRMQ